MGEDGESTFTKTPNALFDVLPTIRSLAELKALLLMVRNTCGWHKESDCLSISQFQHGTGLSREVVVRGVRQAVQHGWLRREPEGNSHRYWLAFDQAVGNPDQSGKPTKTSRESRLVGNPDQSGKPTKTSRESRPKLVGKADTQKKERKERKGSDAAASHGPTRKPRKISLSAEYAEEFKTQFWPLYPRQDGQRAALAAYAKERVQGASAEQLSRAATYYAVDMDEQGRTSQYIKTPENFLLKGLWRDYVDGLPNAARDAHHRAGPAKQGGRLVDHSEMAATDGIYAKLMQQKIEEANRGYEDRSEPDPAIG